MVGHSELVPTLDRPGNNPGGNALSPPLPVATAHPPPLPRSASGRRYVLHQLPTGAMRRSVLVIDCETTGLGEFDRIVSLAAVPLKGGQISGEAIYLAFDPGRKCTPEAHRIHGLSDKMLARQPPFSVYAERLARIVAMAELVVAHHAAFDLDFLARDFERASVPFKRPIVGYCTMLAYAADYPGKAKSLAAAARALGLGEQESRHSAMHDVALAVKLFQKLNDFEPNRPDPVWPIRPLNLVEVAKSATEHHTRLKSFGNNGLNDLADE